MDANNLPKVKLNLDSIKKNNSNLSNNESKEYSNEKNILLMKNENKNKKLFLNTTSKFETNYESKIPHSIFNRFEKKINYNFYKN